MITASTFKWDPNVADIKSTTSKIKYYKTKQYSTIKKTGFTPNTKKTKKFR